MFYLSALLVLIADQLIKFFIHLRLMPNQSLPILSNILHLTYVQNRGAIFGLFRGQQWFLALVGILVAVFIVYYHFKLKPGEFLQVPLGLVLGGSLGNLLDRVFKGYVVDFVDVRIWPVFNLADAMIDLGVFLIIAYLFLKREEKHVSSSA